MSLVHATPDFQIALPPDVSSGTAACDVILAFYIEASALAGEFAGLAAALKPAGGLWIAWPKKSSGVATDLNENRIRDSGLATGMVDNKVCAVTDVWSGLRFVYRIKDRPRLAS